MTQSVTGLGVALDYQDETIINDAVRLLKSEFCTLYVGLGYKEAAAGAAWHIIRTSKKGQDLMSRLYPAGKPKNQALSFISNMKEEIEERKVNHNKKIYNDVPVVVEEEVVVKEKKEKVKQIKSNNTMSTSKKGEKKEKVLALIEKGIVNAKEVSEQAGTSLAYAKWVLEQQGHSTKRVKKEKIAKVVDQDAGLETAIDPPVVGEVKLSKAAEIIAKAKAKK